jgi:hypothetical protein
MDYLRKMGEIRSIKKCRTLEGSETGGNERKLSRPVFQKDDALKIAYSTVLVKLRLG